MDDRRAVTLRSAVLAGGIAALVVCALATLDAMFRGRAAAAFFFGSPWILLAIFMFTRSRMNGGWRR